MIQEAIRKIALGRSIERIEMAPGGMGGVGTARMIHGYVAKIHDDPSDEEFADYGGTVDVGEYPDETASAGGIIHKGVLLAAARNNEGGFLIVPTPPPAMPISSITPMPKPSAWRRIPRSASA